MTTHHQQHRAAIDQLKAENARLQALLVQKQGQSTAAGPAWLESQIRLYRLKAHQEEQLAEQIQRELENIRQQLKLQAEGSSIQQPSVSKGLSGVSSSIKQQVILQERLSHQKQKLDSINAGNTKKQKALQDIAKCTLAAQQLAQQLHRQLCNVQAEAESVQQLTAAVQATQWQAAQLSELLQSQDDAEHLAVSAVAKQVSDLQLQHQQRLQERQEAAYAAAGGMQAQGACQVSCSEEEAQRILDHLCCMLEEAGLASECNPSEAAGTGLAAAGTDVAAGQSEPGAGGCQKYAGLVRKLAQLEADNYRLFMQCSLADWQRQHEQQPQAQP